MRDYLEIASTEQDLNRRRHAAALAEWGRVWKIFTEHWQTAIPIGTGLIYSIGYINATCFLRQFGVFAAPTEVYTLMGLFVWGLSSVLGGLLVPIATLAGRSCQ